MGVLEGVALVDVDAEPIFGSGLQGSRSGLQGSGFNVGVQDSGFEVWG